MSALFERIILSRPFKFIVGEDEVPITVHEQAFADQSPALRALMQGKMSESLTGETVWRDVDQKTFLGFTQFAYTGDYSVPIMFVNRPKEEIPELFKDLIPVLPVEEPDQATTAVVEADVLASFEDDLGFWSFSSKKKKKKNTRPSHSKIFSSLTYPLLDCPNHFENTCGLEVREGPEFEENISDVLLLHTSLYVLAEKWGIYGLKMLALSKLHQTLSVFPFSPLRASRIRHIINLTEYAYSEENTPDLVNGMDELRDLVCKYVAANAVLLTEQPEFVETIEDGGAFVRDVWKRMVSASVPE